MRVKRMLPVSKKTIKNLSSATNVLLQKINHVNRLIISMSPYKPGFNAVSKQRITG